ncbi:hypothetical protein SUGI_0788090 [Cryptomeria japonica]|nr:hypothetical protein SUGI_0788090 [Cryptomeria japonica]
MVMGQVTILKRGHTVESTSHTMGQLDVSPPKAEFAASTMRSARFKPGAYVKMSKAKPRAEKSVGLAFANSSSPSCLPLPKFFVKKMTTTTEEKGLIEEELPQIDSSTTRELRRLLGLSS